MALIALCLQSPGPPLHLALDQVVLPMHRTAVASLLCGDWYLAKYAHNYFARKLLPHRSQHLDRVDDIGVPAATICLSCWHYRRTLHFEDEFHVVCVCPQYWKARDELLRALPEGSSLDTHHDLCSFSFVW